MRTTHPVLLLLLVCLPPASTLAQTSSPSTPSPTSDPQAVALLQRALNVLTAGASISDVTLTGSAHSIAGSDDETGTATLKATSLGDSLVDLNLSSGTHIEIRNHSGIPLANSLPPGVSLPSELEPIGAWSGSDGVLHGMAAHNVLTDATWFFPALTLERLTSSSSFLLSYVGQETHNGQAVIHLSAWLGVSPEASSQPQFAVLAQRLSELEIFLDPSTSLPVALAFNSHPEDNFFRDIAIEVQFSDYQAVSGVQVPMHVQKYVNNGLSLELQLGGATLNTGLSGSNFTIQ